MVLLIQRAHGGGGGGDDVVDKEEEGVLWPQTDSLPDILLKYNLQLLIQDIFNDCNIN